MPISTHVVSLSATTFASRKLDSVVLICSTLIVSEFESRFNFDSTSVFNFDLVMFRESSKEKAACFVDGMNGRYTLRQHISTSLIQIDIQAIVFTIKRRYRLLHDGKLSASYVDD